VIQSVCHTGANGLPLGAELNEKYFKAIFLDIALAQTVLGLPKGDWVLDPARLLINQGPLTEAFVGQELLAHGDPGRQQQLYCWSREKAGSQAEVDYVTEIGRQVVPIEVKSGPRGRLKSLEILLAEKPHIPFGIHLSPDNFNHAERVRGYPLYAVGKLATQQLPVHGSKN